MRALPTMAAGRSVSAMGTCHCRPFSSGRDEVREPYPLLLKEGILFAQASGSDGRRLRNLQASREKRGEDQRQAEAGNARRPSKAIEELAEHETPDDAAEEVACEIHTAR